VTVKVFQGERKMAADNRLLGEFNLEGIPPAPRGVPQIEVKFDIDAERHPQRLGQGSGDGQGASCGSKQSAGLSEDEIEKMRKDAERTPRKTSGSSNWPRPATRRTRCATSSRS
jgi:molecular chaperone DnaK